MALAAKDLNVGDTYTECLVEDLKRTQIVMYAGSSGDYNPVHTDEKFTKEIAGYPSVFAHGMLTMGMTGRMVTTMSAMAVSLSTVCALRVRYGQAIR